MSKDRSFTSADEDRAATEAAHWFVRLSSPSLDELERARFREWFAASAVNRREFDQLDLLWRMAPTASELAAVERRVARAREFNWRMTDAWRDSVCPLLQRGHSSSLSVQQMIGQFGAAVPAFLL